MEYRHLPSTISEVRTVSRIETFTFRVTPGERRQISAVAERLDRTESDTMRWLLREAARTRGVLPQPNENTNDAPWPEKQESAACVR
jgi:hypothetical protein